MANHRTASSQVWRCYKIWQMPICTSVNSNWQVTGFVMRPCHHSLKVCWGLCDIWHPPEKHLKPKSREISSDHKLFLNDPFVLKFCTGHSNIIAMLFVNFQNDWTSETDITDEPVLGRIEIKTGLGWIFLIAQPPWLNKLGWRLVDII